VAAIDAPPETTRTFNIIRPQEKLNSLSVSSRGRPSFPCVNHHPSIHRGTIFDVHYLFRQSGIVLTTQGEELDKQIDEGFEEIDDQDDLDYTALDPEDYNTAACPVEESDSDEEEETEVGIQIS
jgi:hypothetical protein